MKLTTARLKKLIREELEKTIKENMRTKDDLEQMNGKVFIDKLTAQAQKLKSDKYVSGENLKSQAKIAEAFLSIAKMQGFKNSFEGIIWMRDNAVGIIEKRLPEEVFKYANPRSVLDDMLKF